MNKLLCSQLKHLSKQNLHKSFSSITNTSSHSNHLLKSYNSLPKPPTSTSFLSHIHTFAHLKPLINSFVVPRTLFLKNQLSRAVASPLSSAQKRRWSSGSPGYSSDNLVWGLLVANACVVILWQVIDRDFMCKNFQISVDNLKSGRVHTLITSAFSTTTPQHILFNMFNLYFFGRSIGRIFGPEILLKLYLHGAVVGSIFHLVYHGFLVYMFQKGTSERDYSKTPGLGSGGAVYAVTLLYIFLFPKSTIYLDFIIPVPAMLLGVFMVGKDVLRMIGGDQEISGPMHLGGAALAAAVFRKLKKGRGLRF